MIHNRDTREITRDPPFALVRTHSLLEMFFVRVTLRRFPIFRSRKHVVFVWLKRRLSLLRLSPRRVSYRWWSRRSIRRSSPTSSWRRNRTNLLCENNNVRNRIKNARFSRSKKKKSNNTYLSYRYREPSRIGASSIVRPAWM